MTPDELPDHRISITPQFSGVQRFAEGVAAASIAYNASLEKWGYINTSGKFVIEPQFDYAELFSFGTAVAGIGYHRPASQRLSLPNIDQCKYGLINKEGAFLIQPSSERLYQLERDVFGAQLKAGERLYVDSKGTRIYKPTFNEKNNRVRASERRFPAYVMAIRGKEHCIHGARQEYRTFAMGSGPGPLPLL
jgi:hypothetical protein